MKKSIIYISLGLITILSGCYSDNSTIGNGKIMTEELEVGTIEAQNAIAYNSVLEIDPVVTGGDDSPLSYAWYIYGGQFENETEGGYRTHKIGDEKKLSYEVDLKSGNYTLVFEVTHTKTGYAVISETSLKVTTMFSEGFYILKETPEGNTDIDLFNADSEIQVEDILTSVHGAALTGKPGVLNIVYDMAHIDPATAKTDYASALFITAGDNNFSIYRANDMLKIFDRTNLLYGEMSEDDTPQYMCSGMYNLYFSSKGIRQAPSATWGSEYDTGKLGYPAGIGASNFVQACNGDGFIYWSNENKQFIYSSGSYTDEIYYPGNNIDWDDLNPIATGWNHLAGENTMWFILENSQSQRFLIIFNTDYEIVEYRAIKSDLNIYKSDIIAGNRLSSYCIYSVANNNLYSYSLDPNGTESGPITFTGIPGDEQISYISDIYFSTYFNYLIAGTQKGNNYKLYMYKIVGGQPYGDPLYVVSGTGKIKDVRYLSQTKTWFFSPNYYAFTSYALLFGMGPDYPY